MSHDNLPPLPKPAFQSLMGDWFSGEQLRQAQRDAVAASGAGVPDGWKIERRQDNRISASHEKHGFFTVDEEDDNVRASVVWLMLNDWLAAAPTPDRATMAEAAAPDISESQMDAAIEAYDKAWNPANRGRGNKEEALRAAFKAFGAPAQPAPVAAPVEAVIGDKNA